MVHGGHCRAAALVDPAQRLQAECRSADGNAKIVFPAGQVVRQLYFLNKGVLKIYKYEGSEPDEVKFYLNPTFLTDGLQAINAPFVHISFTGDKKPAVLTGKTEPSGAANTSYKYLLMPMRYTS